MFSCIKAIQNLQSELKKRKGLWFTILTGKKTVLQYIIKPLKDISKNALSEQ